MKKYLLLLLIFIVFGNTSVAGMLITSATPPVKIHKFRCRHCGKKMKVKDLKEKCKKCGCNHIAENCKIDKKNKEL